MMTTMTTTKTRTTMMMFLLYHMNNNMAFNNSHFIKSFSLVLLSFVKVISIAQCQGSILSSTVLRLILVAALFHTYINTLISIDLVD